MRRRFVIDQTKTTQFTDAWIILAIMLTFAGLLFRRPALVWIAALLLVIVPVSWLWNRWALRGIQYRRTFSVQRAFVGETVDVTLHVTNRKLLPLGWLQINDAFPLELPLLNEELQADPQSGVGILTSVFSLRWYEQIERVHTLQCEHRGYYSFGPARMKAGDMFGLFENEESLPVEDWMIVYPQVLPLEELGLPAKDPLGEQAIRQRIFEDPTRTMGIRDYQPEDGFRRIHWKATARRQSLQVRVFEPTTAYNVVVFLNVANFERFWHGYDPVLLEKTITVAASVASFATERRYAVGLVANGCLPGSDQPIKVPPGRSPDQLTRILEMLAAVRPIASALMENLLVSESVELPWGSTIVVVTGIVTEAIAGAIQRLRDAGRHMVLISLEEKAPPRLDGVLTYHVPALRDATDDAAVLAAGLSAPPPAERPVGRDWPW